MTRHSVRKTSTSKKQQLLQHGEQLEPRTLLSATDIPTTPEPQSLDGSDNNLLHEEWGSAGTAFLRVSDAAYADGTSAPSGEDRPSARLISNALAESPAEFGPRKYLGPAREKLKELYKHKIVHVLGSANKA